jgi:uncharacterized protein (DUF1015 family)
MPDIRPFKGVLYNPRKIKDISRVVTAPYDVINFSQRDACYREDPYNIIRLILGKHYPSDDSKNNQYTRAKGFLADWLKQEVLLRDEKEGIYIYSQTFRHNNKRRTRTGFIVLLKLENFSEDTILPHEDTRGAAVSDRLKLLETVHANLSPIFATFIDPQAKANEILNRYKKAHRPYIVIKKDGVVHSLWRMTDKRKIAAIQKLLKQGQTFIADGHHRYEAALAYKTRMRRKKGQSYRANSSDYVMTYLVPASDPGLAILPTHRAVKVKSGLEPAEIISNLEKDFTVHKFCGCEEMLSYLRRTRRKSVFGAYLGKKRFFGLELKKSARGRERGAHKNLDVTVLHNRIIDRVLHMPAAEQSLHYTRDALEAVELVDRKKYQAAFFLRPATIAQVKRIACAGKKMPHKSTYFYPKLLTGIVINKW